MLRQGPSGHNILRGPGAFGVDVGSGKNFRMTERYFLEFRGEAFNVLNHPTFGLPDSRIDPAGNNSPARITNTTSLPRIIQFALKFHS